MISNSLIFTDPIAMIILSTEDPTLREKLCSEKLDLLHRTNQISQDLFNNKIDPNSEELFIKMMKEDYKLYQEHLPGLRKLVQSVSDHIQDFNNPETSSNMRIAIINRLSTLLHQPQTNHAKTSNEEEKALRNQAENLRKTLSSYDKSCSAAQESIKDLDTALDNNNIQNAIRNWIAKYGREMGPTVWNKLNYFDCFYFYKLIKEAADYEFDNSSFKLMEFLENSPPKIKNFFETFSTRNDEKFFNELNQYKGINKEQKFIEISNYIELHKIPINSLLGHLSEQDCLKLAPHLIYADLRGCPSSIIDKFLTNCSNVQILHITNSEITTLPALPKCKTLDCSGCKSLKQILQMPLCKKLICKECEALIELPELLMCQYLDCSFCKALEKLPALLMCKELNCKSCIALQQLLQLPKCIILDCSNCEALQRLLALPACKNLNCQGCKLLQGLPALPMCQHLDCSFCIALLELPDLPWCQNLNCRLCSVLRQIGALPWCRQINYSGCDALEQLPVLSPTALIITSEIILEFHVEISQFKKEPNQLLLNLGKDYLLKNSSFPTIYYYENGTQNIALDAGGVKRDFVTRLMENIFKPESEIEKNLDLTGNFLIMADGYPKMDQNSNTETAYRSLGRLLAQCISKDSTFKTGPLFADQFYGYLLNYSPTDSINCMCTMFCGLRDLPPEVLDFILSGKHLSEDKALFNFSYILDEEDPMDISQLKLELKQKPNEYRQKAKEIIEKTMRDDLRYQALALIAGEIKKALKEETWNDLVNEGGTSLKDKIEGKLDAELLLNQITWNPSENVSEDNLNKTKGFITNWIRASKYEQLEKFVQVISSNKTLCNEKLKIEIYDRSADILPVAHTCLFSLEIPCTYPSQEVFDNKIELLLTEGLAGSGFQSI